uniref:Uncharacterized protein n=1 Tax=Acrobeloides nanus TaxID=290746 RepID=A0A914CZI6_9BILA
MEFLNEENKWEKEAEIFIKPLASEESYTVDVFLCLAIDRMNYSANQALKVQHKVEVKWRDQSWTFSLNFSPIMSLKTMTSVLEDRVLFEVDIQRCDGQSNMFIQPINAEILQHNSVVKPPMEAKLLNPLLEPILENSSVRIIWQIPVTKIDKTVPIKHHLKLLYQVEWDENKPKNENGAIPQCAFDREYVFKEDLTFCIHKAEYEVCAQVLSEHPQTVLCRAESQCDLLISLRSLANRPEYIIVVVETDPEYWTSVERFKIVQIKESGIGRTSFGIIPKQVGFLPYPSIYIHKCNAADHNDKESLNETELFGERLTSFHRNQGKQIHVLGQLIPSEDAVSSHSTGSVQKISLKTSAKQKIQKLFE